MEIIRIRAIALGFFLSVIICAVTPYNNTFRHLAPLGGGHFPLAPFFILIWLTLLIAMTGRLFKRTFLTGKELITVWMLMVLGSGIAYTGLARTFFINLTAPWHFATVGNGWKENLWPLLPKAWYPSGMDAIESMYNGLSGGRHMGWIEILSEIPWNAWAYPLVAWGGFVFLCYMVMISVVNLFSRQWIHNERMNFPLLRVPMLMGEAVDKGEIWAFFTNRFLIAGMIIPIFIHLVNGLNFYFPQVPHIPTLILAGPYFPKHGLFSGFHKLKIYIYPAFIGFAFLTSRQISLSFWLFFLLGGLFFGILSILGYNIPSATLGTTFGPTLSRPEETQMIGAYGICFLFIMWLSRYHLLDIIKQAFGIGLKKPVETEWFSTALSFWLAFFGILAIILWCWYFGMPIMISFLVVGAFFMVMVVASRVICQGGVAYFTLTVAPIDGIIAFFGAKVFTKAGILAAAVTQKILFLDLRESLMPSLIHAASVTHKARNKRVIIFGIVITLVAAVIVSFAAMLALCYKFGARELQLDWATRTTTTMYSNIQSLIISPYGPRHWVMIFSLAGAVIMLMLVICYYRFYWWPVHPIGYLMTYSSAMRILWVSFFIGWLCNVICMRYGGVVLFKKLRYFFIGLIIGDFLMGGAWGVLGFFQDVSYLVLPD